MPTTDQILQQEGGTLSDQLLALLRTGLVTPTFAAATVAGPLIAQSAALTGNLAVATQSNITAHAGGGQNNAVPLVAGINQISTVASNNDSVRLPASAAGIAVVVMNNSANNANLYPAANEAINQGANNAAFTMPGNKNAIFFCPVVGTWAAVLTA